VIDASLQDAVRAALRKVKAETGLPVTMAGECDLDTVVLNEFIGMRTNLLKDLRITSGEGLGGRALSTARPLAVPDYGTSSGITHEYVDLVRREGLRAMVAVPVVVNRVVRVILYGAVRHATPLGDTIKSSILGSVRELTEEIRVRDEVARRLDQVEVARAEVKTEIGGTERELLRQLHGELRAIAAHIVDPELRTRLTQAGNTLASVGRPAESGDTPSGLSFATAHLPAAALSAREVDVLSQVALGCTNAEVAAQLLLAPETVKAYLRSAASKLGTSSRLEAVARARLLGYLP
jgi:DNA-binding CsgD family transcriptional regulator